MKRFNFRLEPLLKVRQYSLDQAKAALAEANGACTRIEMDLEENARKTHEGMQLRFRKGGNIQDFLSGEYYVKRLGIEKEKKIEALAIAEIKREKMREKYIEASRKHELIDKLRDKAEREYYRNARLEEVKMLDDLAGGVAARLAQQSL